MRNSLRCLAVAFALLSFGAHANPDQLSEVLAEAMKDGNEHTGYSFYVIDSDEHYGAMQGTAAPDGTALAADHMFRIASITKSYTAATVLRLVEQNRLDLDARLTDLISADFDNILRGDKYDTSAITLRHVLSHTAGLYDHGQSSHYIDAIFSNSHHVWTREEQIKAAAVWGDPVGAPGEKFFYSDTGYLLLGHIIERTTGNTLPLAAREHLRFEQHKMVETVWERGDSVAVPNGKRVHQFLSGRDTYTWDPSVDMYGGGGLVATPRDVARFYQLLLGGKIFDQLETLQTMLSADGLPPSSPYRLGIFEKDYGDVRVYEHGGFWGTLVFHEPSSGTTIAGAALRQSDYPKLVKAMVSFLASKQP